MRFYGALSRDVVKDKPVWRIATEPHVMIRLKRIFPRVVAWRTADVTIADTPEIARELTWVLARWPMEMADDVASHLRARDQQHRDREEIVEKILGGYEPSHLDHTEPARPLRDYQRIASELILATGQLLLIDDVGLGKSTSAAGTFLSRATLPALVVTMTHLPSQWVREINTVLPWLDCHVAKTGKPYKLARHHGREPDVLIMSYSKLAGWADHLTGNVRSVIFDEAQELRRDTSQRYQAAAQVADAADFRSGLTATPVYNYGGEIWNVLNVIAPDVLGSKEEFKREWGGEKVHDPAALGRYLRETGVMLGRTRKEVGRELPPVQRIEQAVDIDHAKFDSLTFDAADLAKLILAEATTKEGQWEQRNAQGQFDMKLRHATGVAKAPYVAEFTRLLLESGEPVLLFGWHRDAYEIWLDRLAEYRPALYTGSESPKQKEESGRRFIEGDTNLLMMSLRAGAGLDGLQKRCSVAVFGELDWAPGVHTQCIGRINRDGQDTPVVAYFAVADSGADPMMAEVLELKRQQSEPIHTPDAALIEPTPIDHDKVKLLAQRFLDERSRHG